MDTPRLSARKEATGRKKAATPTRKNPGKADTRGVEDGGEDEDDNVEVEDDEAHAGTRWTIISIKVVYTEMGGKRRVGCSMRR